MSYQAVKTARRHDVPFRRYLDASTASKCASRASNVRARVSLLASWEVMLLV